MKKIIYKTKKITKHGFFWPVVSVFFFLLLVFFTDFGFIFSKSISYKQGEEIKKENKIEEKESPKYLPLDKELYDFKLNQLANNPIPEKIEPKLDPETGEVLPVPPAKPNLWPVLGPYPKDGAILPFNRIIAYYGNLYSKNMGVLGEFQEDIMLQKLKTEVQAWTEADPSTPALPALHYIAMTSQADPGKDGKYRARMPDKEIQKVLAMAEKINAIVFLDIQVGHSNIYDELPYLEKYLILPHVHLGIDPEWYMREEKKPGKYMGTMDASEINFAVDYLSNLVQENNLPPKILVIHRFTQKMVTNYQNIKLTPEVQIVMHMDGWGGKAKKIGTYKHFIYKEPVQFTGFKIFYKNDIKEAGTTIFTPTELLKLNPIPIYIQYQ